MIFSRADKFKHKVAIVSRGKQYAYDELAKAATILSQRLLDGAEDLKESRVVFLCPPGFDYVVTQWAIWMAGGIVVPLCTLHPYESLAYVVENCQADTIIMHAAYQEVLGKLADHYNLRGVTFDYSTPTDQVKLPRLDMDRKAMILYTSGTTNKPKGVVTTHGNITSQIKTLVEAWAWTEEDYIINILPLHHVHGIINVVSCALWSGATVEFIPKFDAATVWNLFSVGRLTLFMAVPTIYYKLIKYWASCDSVRQKVLSDSFDNMRLMVSGSAALPVPVLEKWKDISGLTLLERYGMTEIGMALSNPYHGERRPGYVGLPLPGIEIRLVDEKNHAVAIETPGEIQIKGPNVFKEYWNQPVATADAFVDGWFRTGDIAQLQDGMYKILGRDSVDIIKSGGYKISALEIESILLRHPEILECAVVGIPDEEWGELLGACLIIKSSHFETSFLKGWLVDKLPGYKVPREYRIVDSIPKNTLGKVVKGEVKKLFLNQI